MYRINGNIYMGSLKRESGGRSRVRCAVIGVGGYGATRRRLVRESGAFELVGGVEVSDAAFAVALEEEGSGFQRFASVEAACDAVEAVFVCTPAHLHFAHAMTAARRGCAIFVEKPLAHEIRLARELVTYCEQAAIPHGHGFTLRNAPVMREFKRLLDEGRCGNVVSVSATSMHSGGFAHSEDNWRFSPEWNPGGPLFQCGIHKIDLLRWIFGEGSWVGAVSRSNLTASETEDSYVLLGEFGDVPCTLHCHYVTAYHHGITVFGTEGNLYLTDYPTSLLWQKRSPTSGVETAVEIAVPLVDESEPDEALCEFAAAIREERQPQPNGRDGLEALELVIAASNLAEESTLRADALVGVE